ncbi:DUF1501 domain-containing protein [Roseiconus nitratireducens]|uniref:DUF1501 domain-containing protein n=2 Tax=Roseiconus nitratireducens TaxID=2605748 RepID=A0A5M6DM69_9BACT|nr:DUF1501 domain-containing protein [Roseiconus nitratireducens]
MSIDRRQLLRQSGMGIGMLALSGLLNDERCEAAYSQAAKEPHFPGRAKRVIHLFANGGPSQIDSFDPKPALKKFAGKTLDPKLARDKRLGGVARPSSFKFQRHGESGLQVSELFPNIAQHVDKLCVIRSMVSDVPNHEPGLMMMNCGDIVRPRPSVGSWTLYGLGTENQSLPGFIVMCPKGLPTAATANWRSAFLPGIFQGTHVDTQYTDPEELIANIGNDFLVGDRQKRQLDLIQDLNQLHLDQRGEDQALSARIESLELAFRMQGESRDAFDLSDEPKHIRDLYGDTLQGRQMLIARRLSQRGVRYVQVYHGAGQPWDSHAALDRNHRRLAGECDQPIAALLADLEQQGLLDETLVIWGGEMGRTPTVQLPVNANTGRDHHVDGFTIWMAGGGVRGGMAYGETDEVGLEAVQNRMHVHDLHATILHLLGFDHTRLTYRYAGRDFRLTDVHGNVVKDILA